MYRASSDLAKSRTKFNPKMQNLNVSWTWPEVKWGIFLIGFQIQWRAVRHLIGEAQFFFTHMFAKNLFKTINDKQMIRGVVKDGDTRGGECVVSPCMCDAPFMMSPLYSGPAPRGHSGLVPPQMPACAPPNENCTPPKRGLCPEETNRLRAIGMQIEA